MGKILSVLLWAFFLCIFSTFQKIAIGSPLAIQGYLVPAIFGGITGLIVNIYICRLKEAKTELIRANEELESKVKERTVNLQKALDDIKTLKGILPLCSHCKKIRDDEGYWNQVDTYIQVHTEADVSHSLCPECIKELYPDLEIYDEKEK